MAQTAPKHAIIFGSHTDGADVLAALEGLEAAGYSVRVMNVRDFGGQVHPCDLVVTSQEAIAQAYRAKEGVKVQGFGDKTATAPSEGITEISGISAARAAKLAELGVTTFEQLVGADAAAVAEAINGASEATVVGWQDQARQLLASNQD